MKNLKLKRYKQSQEKKNREKVLYALKELKEATPSKILEFIDIDAEKEAKRYFENNNISYNSKKLEIKTKELSMVIRTVKSILNKLTDEKLVIHRKGGIYCLNESINNFSLFPNPYGSSIIYSIGNFFPTTIEKSLEEFINRYGLFMIFAFLQLLHFKYSNENENENKESISKNNDLEIENWLKEAIPLKLMYDIFKKLYFSDEKLNSKTFNLELLNGLNKIIEKKYPLLYNKFNDKLKENIEITQMIENNTKKYNKAIDEIDEFLDKSVRESIVLSEDKISKHELPPMFDIRAYSRVLPIDWWNQISRLAKGSS
jgi:hypothetical protein